jgi:hypothetical protein
MLISTRFDRSLQRYEHMNVYVEKVKRLADAFALDESRLRPEPTTAAATAGTPEITVLATIIPSANESSLTKRKRASDSEDESKLHNKQKQAKASSEIATSHHLDRNDKMLPPPPISEQETTAVDQQQSTIASTESEANQRQLTLIIKDTLDRENFDVPCVSLCEDGQVNRKKKKSVEIVLPSSSAVSSVLSTSPPPPPPPPPKQKSPDCKITCSKLDQQIFF